ncbi:alcohol dehydrogenase (NADP+) [Ulvibacter sp. MAR_2010_11]|uniref:aldo/keto reductase n=1 Tax=Ulvibacter sp. MAR_2010_11 TaxID=1250229 RepID=UPI000C2C4445|nr:aldo/keto reductase [Ulvibacter sp. MAR_2010_11]PKA84307.1 alcohol dehydrogenase (NADP+) [Ulvibacter sp. MAR_2010_11]
MKMLEFANGDTFHSIGLGTWKSKGNDLKIAVKTALNTGFRHIDTAAVYGNEEVIGEALAEVFSEGKIFREDVFITSKLWNDAHGEGQVLPALQKSLQKLQLDYLDLYLIHWPVAFKQGIGSPSAPSDYIPLEELPITVTWKQMEKAKELGLVKHIGVSNFSVQKLKDLVSKAVIKPEMNQVELHPLLQQNDLLEYCNSENILLTAYSPLGSGDRSSQMKAEDEPNLMEIDSIKEIAKKRSATAAQVLISWNTHRGSAVIPKSTSKEHIISNFRAADVVLEEEDMETIAKLDKHYRFITGKFFDCPEKGYENVYDEKLEVS